MGCLKTGVPGLGVDAANGGAMLGSLCFLKLQYRSQYRVFFENSAGV